MSSKLGKAASACCQSLSPNRFVRKCCKPSLRLYLCRVSSLRFLIFAWIALTRFLLLARCAIPSFLSSLRYSRPIILWPLLSVAASLHPRSIPVELVPVPRSACISTTILKYQRPLPSSLNQPDLNLNFDKP